MQPIIEKLPKEYLSIFFTMSTYLRFVIEGNVLGPLYRWFAVLLNSHKRDLNYSATCVCQVMLCGHSTVICILSSVLCLCCTYAIHLLLIEKGWFILNTNPVVQGQLYGFTTIANVQNIAVSFMTWSIIGVLVIQQIILNIKLLPWIRPTFHEI